MVKLPACFLALGFVLLAADPPRASAENLPVTVDRYSDACVKTGGGIDRALNSTGTGTLYCLWPQRRDGTECKVGSNSVNRCSIRCSTEACYAANPEKDRPLWPLNGGPSRKKMLAPTNTLAPDTLAPAN
jgi:hypothetical protein